MNVIQYAKLQVATEVVTGPQRHHVVVGKKRGNRLVDGKLRWLGEFNDPHEFRPCRLSGGDKQILDPAEIKAFHRTPYERGFTEYWYTGFLKVIRPAPDSEDPRHSYREGFGNLQYPTGEQYEGEWHANKRHGKGDFWTPKGYKYQGEWREDTYSGHGNETFSTHSFIDGNYLNGLPSGSGVLIYNSSGYRFEGEFKDGLRHGTGRIFYTNGDVFCGTWEAGKRQGEGVTTTRVRGKEIQYRTEWKDDVLLQDPYTIERSKRTGKPKPTMKYSTQGLAPADLTKWKVKDDVTELSMEHFFRIKLGFESLDTNSTGSLSIEELTAIWGKDSLDMLRKLDTDKNGTVELEEIFACWYPNVPVHNIQRFMQLDIHPKQLLRLRGHLCGVTDENNAGYRQIVGIRSPEIEEDKPLSKRQLDAAQFKIGGEKFSIAMYEAAMDRCNPPHFLEILEVWYPNIPQTTLMRYEMTEIPPEELDSIRHQFYVISSGREHLKIADFRAAEERWRSGNINPNQPIDAHMVEGFFKGQPFWVMGSIRLSVPLLQEIEKFDLSVTGGISLGQILRFCYPNVRCLRTRELLTKRRIGLDDCHCVICCLPRYAAS